MVYLPSSDSDYKQWIVVKQLLLHSIILFSSFLYLSKNYVSEMNFRYNFKFIITGFIQLFNILIIYKVYYEFSNDILISMHINKCFYYKIIFILNMLNII